VAKPIPDLALRQAVIATALRMNALGINQGTSGNVSARVRDGFFVTPSGTPYEEIAPADIVEMKFDGSHTCLNPEKRPSSEWRFHLDILKARPDLNAVVHTHGVAATTLACLGREIPAFHYMVAVAGGNSIRCAPYATFGTQELSDHAVAALEGRKACLLQNHGLIACGDSLKRALALAVEVETLAQMYWRVLQAGKPILLPDEEMQRVLDKFNRGYGVGKALSEANKPAAAKPRRKPKPNRTKRRRG
jgi:L-fuculose-phosphate aldolase